MRFRDIEVGGRFKFVHSGYVGTKLSTRTYRLDGFEGHTFTVGTINVEVMQEA